MWYQNYELFAYLLLIALHIGIALHILFTKNNQPSEALFWLMTVMLLPYFGAGCYFLFGIIRLKSAQKRMNLIREHLKKYPDKKFAPALEALAVEMKNFIATPPVAGLERHQLFDRLFPDSPALAGNSLEILRDGCAAYPRMLEDIANAKHCIRMQSYILNSDSVGKTFMRSLEERAAAGVSVLVIFDSVGSLKSYFSHYFRRLIHKRDKNFKIRAFSPFHLITPWRFQLRNHRKLLVIDGKIAYSGGINISAENEQSAKVPPNRLIHDLHCRIEGPSVTMFSESFFFDWAYTTHKNWEDAITLQDIALPQNKGDNVVRVLTSGPGWNYEGTKVLFFAAAATAQKKLWIITPYFVPGTEFVNMLCLTAARGVDVRIIVPANNNHLFVDWASRNFYEKLLSAGVAIYERGGIFSHIKALMVDDQWGFMGSSNCDSRSFRLNFELDFCFEGQFSADMIRQFNSELANSSPITLEKERQKSFLRKLGERICALFSPIL